MAKTISASQLRKSWKKELQDLGFESGSYFSRRKGIISQIIGFQRNRFDSGQVRVNLQLALHNRFLPTDISFVILSGCLDKTKVQRGMRDIWWKEEEIPGAIGNVLQYAVPWLDQHSEIASLAGTLKQCIRECKMFEGLEAPSSSRQELVDLLGPMFLNPNPKPAPMYLQALSLISFEVGRLDHACHYAQRYLDTINPNSPEATSVRNQLLQMGCMNQNTEPQ